jgi:2-dehydro-3-deoxygluconokinase
MCSAAQGNRSLEFAPAQGMKMTADRNSNTLNLPPSDARIVCVGECMVELARENDGRFQLAYGGDTFNTAVYLARLGADVGYLTALGDDPYSRGILETASEEAIDTSLVSIFPGRTPGLYLIETQAGERSFWYWRDRSPARELFDDSAADVPLKAIGWAGVVYFSGVTLSLYSPDGLARFGEALEEAKSNGALVVMDSNYRPRGWGGDRERARDVFSRFWALSDIALPTFDDEVMLWDDPDTDAAIDRFRALGVQEIVMKLGEDGALVAADELAHVRCPATVAAVDTTAAGDSFNAAYVRGRLDGLSPRDAAMAGHRLAGLVIQHRGAVIPRTAMAGFSLR